MEKKKKKFPLTSFERCFILALLAGVSFFMIHPIVGIIVGIAAFLSYRKHRKDIPTQAAPSQKNTPNPETQKLIDTLIAEQESPKAPSLDDYDVIKRGMLPVHIHAILDDMGITTWDELSRLDEKELLYEKCFGRKSLNKIKRELAARGLTLTQKEESTD